MNLKDHIRSIPDFPVKGILFYDIATLLREPQAMTHCLEAFETMVRVWKPDVIRGLRVAASSLQRRWLSALAFP